METIQKEGLQMLKKIPVLAFVLLILAAAACIAETYYGEASNKVKINLVSILYASPLTMGSGM
jgi:hypothetical protein